jgi:hypothetical protein
MPLYEVQSLDVWGNARDIGEIYLSPTDIAIDEEPGRPVMNALVDAGFLGEYAREAYARDEIQVEADEESVQITETVNEEIEGEKPLLNLDRVRLTWNEGLAEPFWSVVIQVPGFHHEDYELHVRASYMVEVLKWQDGYTPRENEIPLLIFYVKPMVNGEPTAEGGPDSFQFYFAEKKWMKRIGFDPITSEPIKLSGDQVADLLVSLDKFMEEGPVERVRYLAQNHGPQSGYAFEYTGAGKWNEATDYQWDTVVVDRDDFGEEVGVVVINGVEMRVWEADELP